MMPQVPVRKSSWLFAAVCCGYFVLGGWASYKLAPACLAIVFVGFGSSASSNWLFFHLLSNYAWLVVSGTVILLCLVFAKQVGFFSERYRRAVNLLLLITAIGFAPMLLVAFALTLSGPFHLIGKLAQ
jgi:hypothetical protein